MTSAQPTVRHGANARTMEVKLMARSGPPKRSSDNSDGRAKNEARRRVEERLKQLEADPLAHPMAPEDRLKPGEILVWFPTIRPPGPNKRS
jgi:hypothetical protein